MLDYDGSHLISMLLTYWAAMLLWWIDSMSSENYASNPSEGRGIIMYDLVMQATGPFKCSETAREVGCLGVLMVAFSLRFCYVGTKLIGGWKYEG